MQVGPVSSTSRPSPERPASYVLTSTPSSPNATISVQPNATIDIARTMKQITIQIALNNSNFGVPPFNTVNVLLSYDSHVLAGSSLDYSTNVFTQTSFTPIIVRDCLDGHAAPGQTSGACGSDDGPGFVSFAESILAGATPSGTEGNIFFLTFDVNTTAQNFSQIQIIRAILGYGSTAIPATTVDGYYTSLICNGKPCSPAQPNFTWLPLKPTQGTLTVFNGSSSLPSPGASITDYFWTFGDTASIKPYRDTGTNSTATYLYQVSGNFSVTLKITDSRGVKASKTILVVVLNADIDMGIQSLDVQPSPIGLLPGVVFTVTAVLRNYGGVTVNASMTMTITIATQVKLLGSLPLIPMRTSTTRTLTAQWDSNGVPPNVYRVDVFTPILKNETKIDNNHKSFWIQLISVQPSGSLSLLSTAGIVVVAVGAGGFGISFLRKRNINPDDAL